MTKLSKVAVLAGMMLVANLAFAGVSSAWAEPPGPCQDLQIACGAPDLPKCKDRTDTCTACMVNLGGAICIPQ